MPTRRTIQHDLKLEEARHVKKVDQLSRILVDSELELVMAANDRLFEETFVAMVICAIIDGAEAKLLALKQRKKICPGLITDERHVVVTNRQMDSILKAHAALVRDEENAFDRCPQGSDTWDKWLQKDFLRRRYWWTPY